MRINGNQPVFFVQAHTALQVIISIKFTKYLPCTDTSTGICMYVCLCIYIHTYTHTYIYIYTHTHKYIYVCFNTQGSSSSWCVLLCFDFHMLGQMALARGEGCSWGHGFTGFGGPEA
uniref:Uncharacterized protein n=1 Tax=Dromaius novaehollandiae TaxID=8790 RepID=A0A8C4JFZ0_DRONO